MWKPKYLDHQLQAKNIAQYYESLEGEDKILKTAEHFSLSEGSIYRYLKYMGVSLPERQRDKTGKFVPTK